MRLGDLDDLKVHISELMLVYSGTELDNAILNAIDNAPSVERSQGEWIVIDYDKKLYMHSCSNLVFEYPYNYCPNCGADMRGEEK